MLGFLVFSCLVLGAECRKRQKVLERLGAGTIQNADIYPCHGHAWGTWVLRVLADRGVGSWICLAVSPTVPCAWEGRMCWVSACVGRTSGHLLLVYNKTLAPGAFPGDNSVEQIPTVQRGPDQCHLHALLLCAVKAPHAQPTLTIPAQPLEPCAECLCLACRGIKLLFMEQILSPFPFSFLSPASSHCHFSLD